MTTLTLNGELQAVSQFHHKFNMLSPEAVSHLTRRKAQERFLFMIEELCEYAEAAGLPLMAEGVKAATGMYRDDDLQEGEPAEDQDMALQFDALLDLVYVAKGTADMMGLNVIWDEGFADVQRANMTKVPGITHRGNASDVTKPPGWEGPRTEAILAMAGYNRATFVINGVVDDSLCLDDPKKENSNHV